MNIHQILNEFDNVFGRKRQSLRVSHIDGHDIMLQAVYARNVLLTEDNIWPRLPNLPDETLRNIGDTANQYVMIRISLEKYQKKPDTPEKPIYSLKMHNDNIYINRYVMSDYKMASDFLAARNEWARQKGVLDVYETGTYIHGYTANIDLGPKLRQQAKEAAEKQAANMLQGAYALANPESRSIDRPIILTGKTNREKSLDAMYLAECALDILLYLQQTKPDTEKTA